MEFVLENTTDYVKHVIQSIKLTGKHRYVLVDIKVQDIESGKYPCIPGWHCDTVIDPYHDSTPEIHHLFVSGSESLTQFMAEPITLLTRHSPNQTDKQLLSYFRVQIEQIKPKITQVPSCQVVSYGRFDFHRGSIGLACEKRLLIRVSESDVVRPRKK